MLSARYGRLRLGRCVSEDFGYLGCVHDVMADLDGACSGRRHCDIRIDETTFPVVQPCHKDLKSYLEASYECLKVTTPRKQHGQYSTTQTTVPPSGFIASISTDESGHGDADTPWVIQVPDGQIINISLWDFGLKAARNRTLGGSILKNVYENEANMAAANSNHKICRVYATIKEGSKGRSVTVCGGRARNKHVYTSDTNKVEIRILSAQSAPNQAVYFLLQYEATGCADPRAPVFGWAKRYGPRVRMGCKDDEKVTWELICHNGVWQGIMGNCTKATVEDASEMAQNMSSLPHGVAVAVVVTIAFLIGSIVLLIGLFCLKCKSRARGSRQVTYKSAAGGCSTGYDAVEKRSLKTTVIGHATMAVTTEVNPRENEYASMKYLREQTEMGDEDNTLNHSQETYAGFAKALSHPCTCGTLGHHHHHHHLIQKCPCGRDHIYESPESGRKLEILKPDIISADTAPQYFDLDPDINLKEAHPLYFVGNSTQEL